MGRYDGKAKRDAVLRLSKAAARLLRLAQNVPCSSFEAQ